MTTTGVFGRGDVAQAKAVAALLSKQAKGGFEGFHNDATVTNFPSVRGSWTVRVVGGCRAFHAYVNDLFQSNCMVTYLDK